MTKRRFLQIALILSVTVSLAAVGIVSAKGGNSSCYVRDSGCTATVSIQVYTGPGPYPVCLAGADLYEVTIQGNCGFNDSFGPLTAVVCSVVSQPAVFVDSSGRTHTLTPMKGRRWTELGNKPCGNLDYSVQ